MKHGVLRPISLAPVHTNLSQTMRYEVVLEGFADYEGKPSLDELRFVSIDDANTQCS